MPEQLSVFFNQDHLGTITLDGHQDQYKLNYTASWLEGAGFAISPHLKPGKCQSESVKRFLANLLPEGKWLEELSIDNQISKNNIFALIAVLGKETTGALTFRFNDEPHNSIPTTFRVVTSHELHERVTCRQQISIARWDNKPRLSVAGVQDKLPLMIKANGEMGFGEGSLASTHLLKFGQKPEMHLVVNEYICMNLARQVNLPVANVALKRYGEPVLVVERFDRLITGDRVKRLHLIDGCQMLDIPPTYKYERPFGKFGEGAKIRTGASIPQLFASCRQCSIPVVAIRDLLNWVLFQLLIGNNDAHGKNISFFIGKNGIHVAPAYDFLNVYFYGDQYDQDLAMAVGEAFRPNEIFAYQLGKMCEECGLPQRQVAASLKSLCTRLLRVLASQSFDTILSKEEHPFAHDLLKVIELNTTRFLRLAEELPNVRL